MTDPTPPVEPREGNLADLDDDTYFAAIEEFPGAVDGAGQPIEGLFDDVIDARPEKRAEQEPEQ